MDARNRIWVPLDVSDLRTAGRHVRNLQGAVGVFKAGLQLIHRVGTPKVVRYLQSLGLPPARIFIDAKLDDIPNTVGQAAAAIADLGVGFFNMHASAGQKAIEEAAKNKGNSKLLVVTVLTSLKADDLYGMYLRHYSIAVSFDQLSETAQTQYLQDVVLDMAIMAAESGADGVICSPQELDILSQDAGLNNMHRYTPGIRPRWAAANDQQRITTPGDAIRKGATGIIVGRPILKPPKEIGKPIDAARKIAEEIEAV